MRSREAGRTEGHAGRAASSRTPLRRRPGAAGSRPPASRARNRSGPRACASGPPTSTGCSPAARCSAPCSTRRAGGPDRRGRSVRGLRRAAGADAGHLRGADLRAREGRPPQHGPRVRSRAAARVRGRAAAPPLSGRPAGLVHARGQRRPLGEEPPRLAAPALQRARPGAVRRAHPDRAARPAPRALPPPRRPDPVSERRLSRLRLVADADADRRRAPAPRRGRRRSRRREHRNSGAPGPPVSASCACWSGSGGAPTASPGTRPATATSASRRSWATSPSTFATPA